MAITETARKNHDELFPDHQSTLTITDPELVEMFDNFAFDEVASHGDLETKTRLMVILASLIAQQTLSEYKVMLGAALNVGVTPVEVKEIIYQAVPYVGIAKVFDFVDNERSGQRTWHRASLARPIHHYAGHAHGKRARSAEASYR